MSENLPAPILPEFPPKAEFRKWLRSLPPDARVAEDWTCHDCPLAMWLYKTGTFQKPYIRPDSAACLSAWRDGGSPVTRLPEWANKFGKAIDRLGRRYRAAAPNCSYGSVTAADCLRVLARTPKE